MALLCTVLLSTQGNRTGNQLHQFGPGFSVVPSSLAAAHRTVLPWLGLAQVKLNDRLSIKWIDGDQKFYTATVTALTDAGAHTTWNQNNESDANQEVQWVQLTMWVRIVCRGDVLVPGDDRVGRVGRDHAAG